MAWTGAENVLLDQLVAEGSDIVMMQEKLGKSASAIRSRLQRMRVSETPLGKPVKEKKPARIKKPRPIIPLTPPRLYPIDRIGPRGCRWPMGDFPPRHPDFHFCGATIAGDGPYCPEHAKRAFGVGVRVIAAE